MLQVGVLGIVLGVLPVAVSYARSIKDRTDPGLNLPKENFDRVVETSREPRIGMQAKDWRDLDGKPAFRSPSKLPTLVVAMGDCQSCSVKAYKPGSESAETYSAVVLIFEDTRDRIEWNTPEGHDRYRVVPDPRGQIHERLNAVWRPRFYLFSSSGQLLRAQGPEEPDSKYISGEAVRP